MIELRKGCGKDLVDTINLRINTCGKDLAWNEEKGKIYCGECEARLSERQFAEKEFKEWLEGYMRLFLSKGFNLHVAIDDKSKPYKELYDSIRKKISELGGEA